VKLEQMDRNVQKLAWPYLQHVIHIHQMLVSVHPPFLFAESWEQKEARLWEGHERRPIKDVDDHVRSSSCIYYANASIYYGGFSKCC
jgi:hypothetical protein